MTLGPVATYSIGGPAIQLVVADFNGDGTPDVATVDNLTGVSVLLNRGDGTFQPVRHYPAEPYPNAIAAADFNRDGRTDIAVVGTELSTPRPPKAASGNSRQPM